MRRDVFQAKADPTRRQIISVIANRSMNLNAVADQFDVSRPAISKHIKILTQCGLISIKQIGRERYCEAKLHTLNAPVQKVWEALTDKHKMKDWYFYLSDFKPEVGFEFSFPGKGNEGQDYIHLCKVTKVEPGNLLQYSWSYRS